MFLKNIDLTTALRPSYLTDEVLLFVQDNAGLYEGKCKLTNYQNGQVYLTSHRICYVDKAEPRTHSVALDLIDVERFEFYAGFLKSSPKITLVPKQKRRPAAGSITSPVRRGTPVAPSNSSFRPPLADAQPANTTWVCTICSFSNPVPSNFDPTTANIHTPLPPCLACGIKPTLTHVLKATIAHAASRSPAPLASFHQHNSPRQTGWAQHDSFGIVPIAASRSYPDDGTQRPSDHDTPSSSFQCPRCTFLNHPSLLSCEICGASLISRDIPAELSQPLPRVDSPGPTLNGLSPSPSIAGADTLESIKIAFRGGGEKIFYERLKGSMTQRKWLLLGATPRVNQTIGQLSGASGPGGAGERVKTAGIAGLEQRGLDMRMNTERVIGTAFEDLEALMASAKEVVALAESLARQVKGGSNASEDHLLTESTSQLGLVTTKDMIDSGGDDSLYLSELSRNLAEFLTDDSRGVLKRAGGIISLVDLWAVFNRARGGVELVSPHDFEKAARLWEKLKLPVRLRTFKSGVMVVQSKDRTDDTTIRALSAWLRELHRIPPEGEVGWDWQQFGHGITAQDAAEHFGWSIGVAEEELEMAEERGVLCREEGIEGLKFWENHIGPGDQELLSATAAKGMPERRAEELGGRWMI